MGQYKPVLLFERARIYSPEKACYLRSSSDRCVQRTSAHQDTFRRTARMSGLSPTEEVI
jgi:hypothetical protein